MERAIPNCSPVCFFDVTDTLRSPGSFVVVVKPSVPSRQGALRRTRTCPSDANDRRSSAMGGRRRYRQTARVWRGSWLGRGCRHEDRSLHDAPVGGAWARRIWFPSSFRDEGQLRSPRGSTLSAPPRSARTTSGTAWRRNSRSAQATSWASVTCSGTSPSRPPTTTSTPAVEPPNQSFRDTDWDTRG